jgi:hypothetical protein
MRSTTSGSSVLSLGNISHIPSTSRTLDGLCEFIILKGGKGADEPSLGRPKLVLFPFGKLFFGELAGGLERILVCEQVKEVLAGCEIFIGDQDGTTKRMFIVST